MQHPPTSFSPVQVPLPQPATNYVERAFWDQHNVIALMGTVVLAAGFLSPIPILVGAFGEALWLTIAPRTAAFRRFVDEQDDSTRRKQDEAELMARPALQDPAFAVRFARLTRSAEELLELCRRISHTPEGVTAVERGIVQLRSAFLDLGEAQLGLTEALQGAQPAQWTEEANTLKQQVAGERDLETRMAIRNAMNALQKRIARSEEATAELRSVEAKLDALQRSLDFFKALTLNAPNMSELVRELTAVLAGVARQA
jgi:hypothetical protein